jgi:uncharacterized membrane protein
MFVLLTLPLGVFLAAIVPLGQIADEPGHVVRAEGLLHGGFLGRREAAPQFDSPSILRAGVYADAGILAAITSPIHPMDPTPLRLAGDELRTARGIPWQGRLVFVPLNSIATYMPVFYAPAALGIAVAKAAGVTPYYAYLAARLANLACYVAAGTVALLIARSARATLFATLLLPTTLNLAASVNQDGLIIASCVLAVALLTTLRPAPGHAAPRCAFSLAAVLIALVAMAKLPYAPLAGLLLLRRDGGTGRRVIVGRLAVIVLIGLAAIGWTWINIRFVAVPVTLPPYEAGPLYDFSPRATFNGPDFAAQFSVILAHPGALFTLPLRTLLTDWSLPHQAVAMLGWLNVVLPDPLYRAWIVALSAALAADALDRPQPAVVIRAAEALLVAVIVALCLQAVMLSQYLTWTPVGMPWIGGVQGRYLLPLLPLLGLIAARVGLPRIWLVRQTLLCAPAAVAIADLFFVPRAIVAFYYLG